VWGASDEPEGDILVFLPGQEEIDNASKILEARLTRTQWKMPPMQARACLILVDLLFCFSVSPRLKWLSSQICQLFASLSPDAQLLAFQPPPTGHRKVIFSTNIAETAVTINGVRYVVDPGYAKVRAYHPGTGMEALKVESISKAQSTQRAGRAGREAAGKVAVFLVSLPTSLCAILLPAVLSFVPGSVV
jgi:HrpA-like RNA helicase